MTWKHNLLKQSNAQYHNGETPTLSDAEYDALKGTTVVEVGATPDDLFAKVTHPEKMLSLDNVFNMTELWGWFNRIESKLDPELRGQPYAVEYKIDGIALELLYSDLKLVRAVTRGNGLVGHDVTHHALKIKSIPKTLPGEFSSKDLVFYGEVYIRDEEFADYQQNVDAQVSNPRNLAAGLMRRIDTVNTHLLTFTPHGASRATFDNLEISTYSDLADRLAMAFYTKDLRTRCAVTEDGVWAIVDDFRDRRAAQAFAADGVVIKMNRIIVRDRLGNTTNYPSWAIALKFDPLMKLTTVQEITWSVGRTGVVVPVAKFDPVEIDDVKVTLATLHSAKRVEELKVRPGSMVGVIRSGDVIPHIASCFNVNDDGIQPLPTTCSSCGSPLERKDAHLFCTNNTCVGRRAAKMTHFVSRDLLNIIGLGPELCDILVTEEIIYDPYDLFFLTEVEWQHVHTALGERICGEILEQVNSIRQMSLDRFIVTLMLPNVGPAKARLLAQHLQSVGQLHHVLTHGDYIELMAVDGVGEFLVSQLQNIDQATIDIVGRFVGESAPFKVLNSDEAMTGPLTGHKYVLTGTFPISRKDLSREIVRLGGTVQAAVSRQTTAVIIGARPGQKVLDAGDMEVSVIDYQDWLDRVNGLALA